MATVAVFIALGGTSYAAIKVTGKNVRNSSLTGADIKTNSVTGKDIKSLGSGDFKKGTLRAGKTGATGPQGPAGAAGSALGYGKVDSNGALSAGKNVVVTVGSSPANYCIRALAGTATNITATITFPASPGSYARVGNMSQSCPAGTQVSVVTFGSNDDPLAQPFFFTVN